MRTHSYRTLCWARSRPVTGGRLPESSEYGNSECRAWDAVVNHPYCVNNGSRSDWCSQAWCYVNGSACQSSTRLYRTSLAYPDVLGLYYSYDTCAGENHTIDEDQFAFYLMEHFGVGRLFRAVIPWSSIPLHFNRDPSVDPYV